MNDRNEISDLIARVGLWLDEKDFDGDARKIFSVDAVADTEGGLAEGVDRLVEQARRGHPADMATQHFITNALIEPDGGDRATVEANMLVAFIRLEGSEVVGGRYRFEVVRTEEGWRISRVEARPKWKSDLVAFQS